jgi:hypothetical protein
MFTRWLTYTNEYNLLSATTELEKSQQMARSLELQVTEAERQRRELEDAQRRAEEARRAAEEAAYLEKAEREIKVGCSPTLNIG